MSVLRVMCKNEDENLVQGITNQGEDFQTEEMNEKKEIERDTKFYCQLK